MSQGRSNVYKIRDVVNVKDPAYGAKIDGSTDDTAAWQAAVNTGSGSVLIFAPRGTTLITGTVTVSNHRVNIQGEGAQASIIKFEPAANDICFDFNKGSEVLYQCSLKGFGFTSSDTTFQKVFAQLSDVSEFVAEDLAAAIGQWTGNNSIGLHLKGREAGSIRKVRLGCDRPIQISENPNSTIDIDHYHFTDCHLFPSSTNPCVLIDSGVNLTNVTFDGYQAWVGGTYGLDWNDTTSSSVSINLRIVNMRTEQGADTTKESIRIVHNTGLQGLVLENSKLDVTRPGLYFRKVITADMVAVQHAPTSSMKSIDATAVDANYRLQFSGCMWSINSTKTLTSYVEKWGLNQPITASSFAAPPMDGLWVYDNGAPSNVQNPIIMNGVRTWRHSADVADGGEIIFPSTRGNLSSSNKGEHYRIIAYDPAGGGTFEYVYAVGYLVVGSPDVGALTALHNSANADVQTSGAGTAGKLSLIMSTGGGATRIVNNLGVTVTVLIEITFNIG